MSKNYRKSSRVALSLLLTMALIATLFIPVASAFPEDIEALEIAGPVADIVTPPAGHYHNIAYAATPAGFRPDSLPAAVNLSGPTDAAIFYNIAVVEVTAGAAPSQAQIDALADPNADSLVYTGPISLAAIDRTHAVIIKAYSFTTAGGVDRSPVATFVYWQRLWVLTDVKEVPAYWTEGKEAWDDYVINLVVAELTIGEKAQLLSGGQTAEARLSTASIGRTAAVPRLCIPATQYTDGPAGVRDNRISTPFPVSVTISSSWDVEIQALFTSRVAAEALYASYDIMLAQGVNTHRSPLGGRNFEYYSEDPILAGRFSVAYSQGLHKFGIGESVKHYVANEQEQNRQGGNVVVDERCIREILFIPFEMAVKEADPFTVMSSYNCMNGPYVNQNPWAQEWILRHEWGFKGYVMTDWGANYTDNCFESGNEVRQSGSAVSNVTNYLNWVGDPVEMARRFERINLCCYRILKTNIRCAIFNCVFDGLTEAEVFRRRDTATSAFYTDADSPQPQSEIVAQAISEAGAVLLRNNNDVLPLAKGTKIAFVYDAVSYTTATDRNSMQQGGDFIVQGGGSGNITYNKSRLQTFQSAIPESGFELPYYAVNTNYNNANNAAAAAAAAVASGADVGIIIVSRMSAEGSDVSTANFNLTTNNQNAIPALANAFHAVGKPLIVIINTGGAINTTDQINRYADAVLYMGLGGWKGPAAICNILNGTVNPSGKMPDSYSTSYNNTVPMLAAKRTANIWAANPVFYDEGNLIGYRWYDTMYSDTEILNYVSYPFGYGLSYTKFEFSDLKLSKAAMNARGDDSINVSVTVTNVGSVAGKEVAQIYIGADSYKEEGRPIKELKYFAKTKLLQPGESQVLNFTINNKRDLQYYDDAKGTWRTHALTGTSTTILYADPTYNLMRLSEGRYDLWEALYAANGPLGYTKEGIDGAGWRVDLGTSFTVTASNCSATVGAYAEAFGSQVLTADFTYGDYASISAPSIVDTVSELVSYDISVGDVAAANMFDVVVQLDKDLEFVSNVINLPASLNAFFLNSNYDKASGIYSASIGLAKAGAVVSSVDPVDLVTLTFRDLKDRADKEVVDAFLLAANIYEVLNSGGGIDKISAALKPSVASSLFRTYWRFDIAGTVPSGPDKKIDNSDIALILFRYYGMQEGDPFWAVSRVVGDDVWEPAQDFDANPDKIINMGDILVIYDYFR